MTRRKKATAENVLAAIRDAWGSWAENNTEQFEDWLFSDKPLKEAVQRIPGEHVEGERK